MSRRGPNRATFVAYVDAALQHALRRASDRTDGGELDGVVSLCDEGVPSRHRRLTSEDFLWQFVWCTGSQQKDYGVRMRPREGGSYWERQQKLFHDFEAKRICADADDVRARHAEDACYLHPRVVDATLAVAEMICGSGWAEFKKRYLPIPDPPETSDPDAWVPTVRRLDELPRVGETTAWYLLRNLLGAPFFKPDIHIVAIAWHFFPRAERPVHALVEATNQEWPGVCARHHASKRVLCPHLGVVDYVLWWYRRETGEPPAAEDVPRSYC